MKLHPKCFDVVGSIGPACEIREIKLYLIPPLVQSHGHGADKWLYPCGALVVRSPKPSPDVLIVQDLHLEGKILLQVLYYHHQEGQFDAQSLVRVGRTTYECRRNVGTHYLQN